MSRLLTELRCSELEKTIDITTDVLKTHLARLNTSLNHVRDAVAAGCQRGSREARFAHYTG